MFWSLPRAAVCGILNGMKESQRPAAADGAAADPDAFFAKKRAAKLAFQQAKGLAVGEENRLLVFMGRITHQKGCGEGGQPCTSANALGCCVAHRATQAGRAPHRLPHSAFPSL